MPQQPTIRTILRRWDGEQWLDVAEWDGCAPREKVRNAAGQAGTYHAAHIVDEFTVGVQKVETLTITDGHPDDVEDTDPKGKNNGAADADA